MVSFTGPSQTRLDERVNAEYIRSAYVHVAVGPRAGRLGGPAFSGIGPCYDGGMKAKTREEPVEQIIREFQEEEAKPGRRGRYKIDVPFDEAGDRRSEA
jgi:hypothetical protein